MINKSKSIRITSVSLINWHRYSYLKPLKIDNSTFITGNNGMGKSTLLDAIYSTLFNDVKHFNKASGDDDRTVKGYVRCLMNTRENGEVNKYSRHGKVVSYILVELFNEEKQNNFVMGVCRESDNETTTTIKHLHFVINNADLGDVVPVENDIPLTIPQFKSYVAANFNSDNVTLCDTLDKTDAAFASYLGFGRGENAIKRYRKAANANARSMAITTKSGLNFTKELTESIAPDNDLDVERLIEMMSKQEELQQCLNNHKAVRDDANVIIAMGNEIAEKEKRVKVISLTDDIATYEALCQKIENARLNISAQERIIDSDRKKELEISSDLLALKKEQSSLANNNLEKQLQEYESRHGELARSIAIKEKINAEKRNDIDTFNEYARKINGLNSGMQTVPTIDFDGLTTDPEQNKIEIEKAAKIMRETGKVFDSKRVEIKAEITSVDSLLRHNETLLNNAKTNNDFPAYAANVRNAINEYFNRESIPDTAFFLCQCMEVSPDNAKWKDSVESFLRNIKFSIVVLPENYRAAINVLEKNKDKIKDSDKISIIDTTAFTSDVHEMEESSLCSLFEYHNIYAKRYMISRFNNIKCVEDCSVIPDKSCSYIGANRSLYSHNAYAVLRKPYSYYIGSNAASLNIPVYEKEIEDCKNKRTELYELFNLYDDFCLYINSQKCGRVTPSIIDDITSLIETKNAFNEITQLISVFKDENKATIIEFSQRLATVNNRQLALEAEQKAVALRIAKNEDMIKVNTANVEESLKEKDLLDKSLNDSKQDFSLEYEEAREQYDKLKSDKRRNIKTINEDTRTKVSDLGKEISAARAALAGKQELFADKHAKDTPINGLGSMDTFKELVFDIENERIPDMQDRISKAKKDMLAQFKCKMLATFKSSIEQSIAKKKKINNLLKSAQCGTVLYQLVGPIFTKEKERFMPLIMDEDNTKRTDQLSLLSNPDNLEFKYNEELEELMNKIISDPDYRDYRNYITFDIDEINIDPVTEERVVRRLSDVIKTNSGGEKQTPLCILAGIGLVDAYDNASDSAIFKIGMLDEAFDRMDGSKTNGVVTFYKQLGFQMIYSSPANRIEVIAPFVDGVLLCTNDISGKRTFRYIPSAKIEAYMNAK